MTASLAVGSRDRVSRERTLARRTLDWVRASRLARWAWYEHEMTVYSLRLDSFVPGPADAAVGRDCWEHLQCYQPRRRLPGREAFLALARERLESGEHVYSVCEDGQLLAWAWMVPNQRKSWLPAVRQEVHYPEHSCVLYGAYTVATARGRGLNGRLTQARLADAILRYGARYAFTVIARDNAPAVRAKHATELTPWLELGCRVRLGREELTRKVLSDVDSAGLEADARRPATPGRQTDPPA